MFELLLQSVEKQHYYTLYWSILLCVYFSCFIFNIIFNLNKPMKELLVKNYQIWMIFSNFTLITLQSVILAQTKNNLIIFAHKVIVDWNRQRILFSIKQRHSLIHEESFYLSFKLFRRTLLQVDDSNHIFDYCWSKTQKYQ